MANNVKLNISLDTLDNAQIAIAKLVALDHALSLGGGAL